MITLHVIADSISMHYGPYLESYLKPWCQYSRKDGTIGSLENVEGPNGQDSPMVVEYIKRCISQDQRWDVVVLNCGLWDIRDRHGVLQTDIGAYKRNVNEIFALAPAISSRIVWVRTTPVDDERHNAIKTDYLRHDADVIRYNAVADEIALERGASIIDLYNFCRSLGLTHIYLDHIHFTDEARRLQAAFIAGQLVARLNLGDRVSSLSPPTVK
jgi:GDSL-like Lipase/Acylhydrolase family